MSNADRKECFAFCNMYVNRCCILNGDVDCKKCRFFKTKEQLVEEKKKIQK